MLRSKIFQLVRDQFPKGVDLQSILDRPDVSCDDLDISGRSIPPDVFRSLLPLLAERKAKRDHPFITPEKARSIGILVGNADLNEDSPIGQIARHLEISTVPRLPGLLQFQRSGFVSYYPDHDLQRSIGTIVPDQEYRSDLLDEGPFEVLLDLPVFCSEFKRTRKAILKKEDLDRANLLDANIAVQFHRFFQDGSPYMMMNMNIFMPRDDRIPERGLYLVLDEGLLASGDIAGAIKKGLSAIRGADEVDIDDFTSSFLKYATTLINAAHLVKDPEVFPGPKLNPYRVMRSRVENKNTPKKQKDRARQLLPNLHDMDVIPVSRNEEDLMGVNDLAALMSRKSVIPEWKPEISYQEKIHIEDSPRLRNPHGQLHPQRMMREIEWIGAYPMQVLSHLHTSLSQLPNDGADLPEEGNIQEGEREIAIDSFALDLEGFNPLHIQPLMMLYQQKLLSVPRDERPIGMRPLQSVLDMHRFIRCYNKSGSQCFILNGEVSRLMGQTEISEIDMCDLKLPYDHMYLAFDTPVEMELDGEITKFTGAYLSGMSSRIDMLMTFEPVEMTGSLFRDLRHPFKISLPRMPGMTLQDSILHALENGGYDLDPGQEEDISPEAHALAGEGGFKIVKLGPTAQRQIAERNERLFGSMVDGVTIVANTIMAMTAGPDEIQVTETWFSPPDDIRRRLEKGQGKDLNNRGNGNQVENCMPIRVISLTQESRNRHREDAEAMRKSPEEAYWRKGHWKRQPHGPRNSLRKWIWLEPKLCNAEAELRRAGTVYHAHSADLSP